MSSEVEVIFENMVISSEMKARRKKTAKTTSQSEVSVDIDDKEKLKTATEIKSKKVLPKQKTRTLDNENKENLSTEKNLKLKNDKLNLIKSNETQKKVSLLKTSESILSTNESKKNQLTKKNLSKTGSSKRIDKDVGSIKQSTLQVANEGNIIIAQQQVVKNDILNLVKSNETPKKVSSPKTPIIIPSTKTSRLRAKKGSSETTLNTSYHKITDFFTQRRSERKLAKKAEEDKQIELQSKIIQGCEEGLRIEEFPEKGRGVITTKNFAKGDFVVEYVGDLIDLPTAKRREKRYLDNSSIGCYMYYFQHRNKTYCIDATAESGKLGRLINHSRKGNLISRVIEIDLKPHLVLFARDDIESGIEVLYDYGDRSKDSLKSHPWLKL